MRGRKEIKYELEQIASNPTERIIIELLLDIRHLIWANSPIWTSKEDV